MESAARIHIESHNDAGGVDPEGDGRGSAREINRGVHTAAQQKAMQVTSSAKATGLRTAVIARDVADVVEPTGVTEIARRGLGCAGNVWKRNENSIAEGVGVVLAVASFVPSCDQPAIIDLPPLRVSIRAWKVNRGEGSRTQQEPMLAQFISVGSNNVTVGVDPLSYGCISVGKDN